MGKIREALLEKLRSLGYSVNFMVLNATDYNVPQARERIFVVGIRGDEHKNPIGKNDIEVSPQSPYG